MRYIQKEISNFKKLFKEIEAEENDFLNNSPITGKTFVTRKSKYINSMYIEINFDPDILKDVCEYVFEQPDENDHYGDYMNYVYRTKQDLILYYLVNNNNPNQKPWDIREEEQSYVYSHDKPALIDIYKQVNSIEELENPSTYYLAEYHSQDVKSKLLQFINLQKFSYYSENIEISAVAVKERNTIHR